MSGELRIILLVLGLALILVIYFKTRLDNKKKAVVEKRIADPSIYLKDINTENERVARASDAPPTAVPEAEAPTAELGLSAAEDERLADERVEADEEMPPIVAHRPQDLPVTPPPPASNLSEEPPPVSGLSSESPPPQTEEPPSASGLSSASPPPPAEESPPASGLSSASPPPQTEESPPASGLSSASPLPQAEEPPPASGLSSESPPPQAEEPPSASGLSSAPPPPQTEESPPASGLSSESPLPQTEESPPASGLSSESPPPQTEEPPPASNLSSASPPPPQVEAPPPAVAESANEAKDDIGGLGGLRGRLGGHLKKGFNGALNKLFQHDAVPEEQDNLPPSEDARLLVLHIRAPSDRVFYGREVLFAADKVGLLRGGNDEKGTFEKVMIDEHGARQIRFYMADMFEPGVFKWATFDETRVRGLSLFTSLSDQRDAESLFDEMVACARNVAALLEGASLLDEKHSTLTNQTISHMRDSLREEASKSHLTGA